MQVYDLKKEKKKINFKNLFLVSGDGDTGTTFSSMARRLKQSLNENSIRLTPIKAFYSDLVCFFKNHYLFIGII